MSEADLRQRLVRLILKKSGDLMIDAAMKDRIRFMRTYLVYKLAGRPPRFTRKVSSCAVDVVFLTEDNLRIKYLLMMAISMIRSLLSRCTKSDVQIIIEHFTLRLTSDYGINGVDWEVLILGITLDYD
jgi:hypothetical protein